MKLSIGIVGLPNVGKSTLFNALTKQQVLAENYPFATIDPNHGVVPVADDRVDEVAKVQEPDKVVHAVVEFVDIAGLVKGAAEGEGLGNQFLGNIKDVSAIAQVVRAFENDGITHVEQSVDPKRDIELIEAELILKDIETVEARLAKTKQKAKLDKKAVPLLEHLEGLLAHLEEEKLGRNFAAPNDEEIQMARRSLFLLTDKPMIYIVNANEGKLEEAEKIVRDIVGEDVGVIPMDIKTESDLSGMDDEEKALFMEELGIEKSGLERLTLEAYDLLGLMSFFTAGPMEVRAWTIRKGESAPEAAGTIHTDIEDNFIAADVVNWRDFVEHGGWNGAKDKGKVRLEGKTYQMQDGDVVLFKHNG